MELRTQQATMVPFPQQAGAVTLQSGTIPAQNGSTFDINTIMNLMITMMIVVMMMKMMTGAMAGLGSTV